MRLLWVTAEPPNRSGGGGNIRQSLLLEAVARAGHQVDLLLAGPAPDAETAAACHRVLQIPVSATQRPARRREQRLLELRLAIRGGPSELYDGSGARRALDAHWPEAEYDVVLVEHANLAPLVSHRRPGEHWVCTLHNIASGTAAALKDLAPGRRQRMMIARDGQQAAALERFVLKEYDSVITVSKDDARLLPGPSTVVPNGVDLTAFAPSPVPRTPSLLFTGTLNYLPNVDGLAWFCGAVLPLVRERVPGLSFEVVGRDPTPEVLDLGRLPGVTVHRDVPSIVPFLTSARVCVVPLRIGTGSRLKALEGMAAARPVVGTSVGLAGLGITDQALIADERADLAAAVVELLTDDAKADDLAERGRRHVQETFGWESVGTQLISHLEAISPA